MRETFFYMQGKTSAPARYALAVGIFTIAAALRFFIMPVEAGLAFVTFYPAAALCLYLCGVGPGALMALLSVATEYYVFTPPFLSFGITATDAIASCAFLISATVIGHIVRKMQSSVKLVGESVAALQVSEKQLRHIIENQTELIGRFKLDGTFTFVNDAFCRFFGKSQSELLGHVWAPFAYSADLQMIQSELKKLSLDCPIVSIENRVIAHDGSVRWVRFINHAIFDSEANLVEIQVVGRDVTGRRLKEDQARHLAFYDPLTSLPNRRLFNDRLGQAIPVKRHSTQQGAVLFIDLDNFKPLNDTYGHDAGDVLLIKVGERLKSCVRESDTVSRIGGDEFAVLLKGLEQVPINTSEQAAIIAEKIRSVLAKPYSFTVTHGDRAPSIIEYQCTASIGVVMFPLVGADIEDYLKWADTAMYHAKESGRNAVRFYTHP